jgi:hypothetical protein
MSLSTPSLGITNMRLAQGIKTPKRAFQLPLSGSLDKRLLELIPPHEIYVAFNSLSRDHEEKAFAVV